MTLRARSTLSGALLALPIVIGTAAAQTTYPNVKVTGRLQEQFYYFDNDPYAATVGSKSNFFTRRARIEARGQISENVTVYIQPSFEGAQPRTSSPPVPGFRWSAVPRAAGCACGMPDRRALQPEASKEDCT
jgi:hypothetical protein